MSFIPGITTFRVNEPIVVQNLSDPGFDIISLGISTNGGPVIPIALPPQGFYDGYTLAFSNPGIKELQIFGTRDLPTPPGTQYSAIYSVLMNIGYSPKDRIIFRKLDDQSSTYPPIYVKRGITFEITRNPGSPAGTEPKTYSWNFAGGISYSNPVSSSQVLMYNTLGRKNITLTTTNSWGTNSSNFGLVCIDSPLMRINASPTFGTIRITDPVTLSAQFTQQNGHVLGDVDIVWNINGTTYSGSQVQLTFGSTGTKGITLFYGSKIMTGFSGSTYGQYVVLNEQFPLYYDPQLMNAFNKNESGYTYYANEMKKYGFEYKYLSPRAIGGFAANTYNATIATFESFSEEERAMPIMINAEEPWLVILYRQNTQGVNPDWATNITVLQEAERQGITLTGLTLAGYKEIAINCWVDIVDQMRRRGCPKMIHYASTGMPFVDYTGIPQGMLEYGPLPGVTTNHYWYQATAVYNPTLREKFNIQISRNVYGALAKAQVNADAHGAAAYCFVPNSATGVCGISYWESNNIILRGYSGGTTFTNATDFIPSVLEDAVKVTSAKMWLEYYRACNESVLLGFIRRSEMPQKIAPILIYSTEPVFLFDNPGGGWRSRYKWHGTQNKDPEKTAENEIAAIFKPNSRVDYSSYDEIKYPDEIWIWDSRRYYNLTTPSLQVQDTSIINKRNVEIWMMRNALEREFFGRPQLSPGNTLWFTGSTNDNITYYRDNSLPNYYWTTPSSIWWGLSGGVYTSLLPSPCNLNSQSLLAPWLDFTKTLYRDDVFDAIKHKLSTDSLNYIIKVREKLNEIF